MYETGYTYEEMAEALKGRSEAAIRNRLSKLRSKGEKREDLYIGGRGVACRENEPEAQRIQDTLILYACKSVQHK